MYDQCIYLPSPSLRLCLRPSLTLAHRDSSHVTPRLRITCTFFVPHRHQTEPIVPIGHRSAQNLLIFIPLSSHPRIYPIYLS